NPDEKAILDLKEFGLTAEAAAKESVFEKIRLAREDEIVQSSAVLTSLGIVITIVFREKRAEGEVWREVSLVWPPSRPGEYSSEQTARLYALGADLSNPDFRNELLNAPSSERLQVLQRFTISSEEDRKKFVETC